MDSIDMLIYIMAGLLVLIFVVYVVGYFKSFRRNKSSFVKAPKMRSKNILQDDENFGSAIVQGVEYVGSAMSRGFIYLLGQDGRIFKQHYWEDQIYPKNALQALGGAERAVWGVKATRHKRGEISNDELIEAEKQSFKMRDEVMLTKAEKEIKVNEAATLPEQTTELLEKFLKQPPKEPIRLVK